MLVLEIIQLLKNNILTLKFKISIFFIVFLLTNSVFAQKQKSEFEVLEQETADINFTASFIEANKQKMLGNYVEAINLYLRCLEINPKSTASMFEIARILYSNNDFAGSLKLMEQAVLIDNSNIWYLYFIGDLYKKEKNYKKALSITNRIIEIDPYNEIICYDKINIYVLMNKFKKAEKEFDIIEKKFGTSTMFLEEKVKFYFQINEYAKAEKMLIDLDYQNPSDIRYKSILADFYFQSHQYNKALKIYDSLITLTNDTASIHLVKAQIFLDQGDNKGFIDEFLKVVCDPSIDAQTKIDIASSIFLDSTNNFKQYEQQITENIYLLHPTDSKARLFYVNYLLNNNEFDKAIEHLYFILNEDKTNINVYNQLLYVENKNKNWDSVFTVSSKALEFYPNQYFLFFYNGFAAYMLEKYDEAINSLMNGVNFSPNNEVKSDFYSYIAESYQKLENKKMSYHFFDKALSYNEKNSSVLNNYSYYMSLEGENLEKALKYSVKSNELEPNNPIYLDTYAWILYKSGKYDEAKVIIEKAISLFEGENGEIIEHYGDILFKFGNIEAAIEQWNNALGKEGASESLINKIKNRTIED